MLIINFKDVKKDETIKGKMTPIKIILTLLKLRYINGHTYPVLFRDKNIIEKGWFVRMGNGGKSGEALIRFNWYKPFKGWRYSSFHAYNRNGKPRVEQNWYVPIKSALIQKKVA